MKAIIASKNQGKIEGARKALENFFDNIEIEGIGASSEVGEQPVNDNVYKGAKNRIKNLKLYCKENNIQADLYLAVESGISNLLGGWLITNIAVIEDNSGTQSFGIGPAFPVPERYVEDIINTNLSEVTDKIFGEDKERRNKGRTYTNNNT
ncbi:MAG: DUF84 family protein [Clostridia bacterium]|nr:DUF84 family protein [Clostridia bacterium]